MIRAPTPTMRLARFFDGDANKFAFNPWFPGQYFDKETNLHYNYFRDYDPAQGRYVESDPIGLDGGINLYVYGANTPLSNIDPFGMDVQRTPSNRSDAPNSDVMRGLECMSKCLKTTINLESGRRTPDRDRAVGGSGKGPHTRGTAADVVIPPSESKLRRAAAECGFLVYAHRYNDGHIHIDLPSGRTPKDNPNECVCEQIRQGQ
jgi:RHS repeat-associated protein